MRLKLKESCKCGAVFEYEESGEGTNPLYYINNFSDRHKECRELKSKEKEILYYGLKHKVPPKQILASLNKLLPKANQGEIVEKC